MLWTAKLVFSGVIAEVENQLFVLVFRREHVINLDSVVIIVLWSLKNDLFFVAMNKLFWSVAGIVYNVSFWSELKNFFDDFLVYPEVVLLIDVSSNGQVKHGVSVFVLQVDVSTKAEKGLNIVFFYTHDSIMQWRSTLVVKNIWIEVVYHVTQVINCYDSRVNLCCTVQWGKAIVSLSIQIRLELEMQYS